MHADALNCGLVAVSVEKEKRCEVVYGARAEPSYLRICISARGKVEEM